MIDFARLSAPFPPEQVSWRVGATNKEKTKGMALAYIDSRDVQNRLDDVCGPAGWANSYPHAGAKTVCRIEIKVGDEWVGKEDGAGDSDVEAEKGALSDAFKRAAVKWGIGRYLYDTKSPWVEIVPAGKSYAIPDHELARLAQMLARGQTPRPASSPAPRQEASPAKAEPEWDAIKAQMLRDIEGRATMVALDKMTGSDAWKTDFRKLPDTSRNEVMAAVQRREEKLTVRQPA